MSIEEIPSDELIEMSEVWHRAFKAAGCDPMCHCCYKLIAVGKLFKLSTVREVYTIMAGSVNTSGSAFVESRLAVIVGEKPKYPEHVNDVTREVMLCDICTPDLFHSKQLINAKKNVEQRVKYVKSGGGCFRVNGKIVT